MFADGENADISANVYDNISVVAGILKLYLRLLPLPLITYEAHPAIIRAIRKCSNQSSACITVSGSFEICFNVTILLVSIIFPPIRGK